MFFLQYSFYVVASILLATKVFSSPQDSTSSGGNLDLALNLASDSSDLTNPLVQGSLIAIQPDINTPPDQGSVSLNNGIANINQVDVQAANLPFNQLNSVPASAGPDINTPSDNSQNNALLFDDTGGGGVTDVLPSFPAPLHDFFPNGLPKFDSNGVIRWFKHPTQPRCDSGKFAFCCQKGPAQLYWSYKPGVPPPTAEKKAEHAKRLRKCRNWSADDPACYFPENEACCDCKSERQTAFFCYFSRWRDDKKFQGKPQRLPLELPNPDDVIDPNPTEPNSSPDQRNKRRDWNLLDEEDDEDDETATTTINTTTMDDDDGDLYASNPPPSTEPSYKHPGGRLRHDSTCTDEYLKKLGVSTNRYLPPTVHTPDNPYEAKPRLPRNPDGRLRINKPNPPPLPIRNPRPPPLDDGW